MPASPIIQNDIEIMTSTPEQLLQDKGKSFSQNNIINNEEESQIVTNDRNLEDSSQESNVRIVQDEDPVNNDANKKDDDSDTSVNHSGSDQEHSPLTQKGNNIFLMKVIMEVDELFY